MEKVSLIIRNVNVFNSYLKKFIPADVSILDGRFYYIDRKKDSELSADEEFDADGMYMIPGFVNIHMHIESSMLTPAPYGRCLAQCGVTTVVSEPHEMANVRGIRGILEMISAAEDTPVDIYYGIPSSVPSTNSLLETNAEPLVHAFPQDFYNSVMLPPLTPEDFEIRTEIESGEVTVRVLEILPDRTQTREKRITMPVQNHRIRWQDSGCLLAMVLERHGKNGNIGYGFITGSCLQTGTCATTWFHDHHNLFVAGDNPDDMLLAVTRIRELQGGILTARDGQILAELPLPICGILSERSLAETAAGLKSVRESLEELGYRHNNPIMSLGTLGLPVSPALKLTDVGLVDVKKGCIVPLIV